MTIKITIMSSSLTKRKTFDIITMIYCEYLSGYSSGFPLGKEIQYD
jgi:hypothetical protein